MSDPTFQQHLMEKGRDYSYPLAAAQNVTDQPVSMMQLAPIPAHLVLDGFSTIWMRLWSTNESNPAQTTMKRFSMRQHSFVPFF